jgi:gluconolactonase
VTTTAATVVAEGLGFTEGPVVRADGTLIVTAIDRGLLWSIGRDGVAPFAVTGGGPNGATAGPDGTIYVAQNGGRGPGWRRTVTTGGVQVVRADGMIEWITRDPVSPNDLCFGPDGFLYVTDPTRRASRDDGRIWRVDVETRDAELVTSTNWYPNGIGFGDDDDALYVASTGERSIVRHSLSSPSLGKREVVCRMDSGLPDGFAFDVEGHLIVGVNGEDGRHGEIQVWTCDGEFVDRLRPIEAKYMTNVALDRAGHLFVTCPDIGGVVRLDWPHAGLELHPFRRDDA